MGEFFPAQVFKQLSHARAVIERHLAATLDTIHLFGSAIDGGLKPDSDIDLLVTVSAAPNDSLRQALMLDLLKVSSPPGDGGTWRPLELTVVARSEVVPWRYPARRELQFGEWLRHDILSGTFEPAVLDHDLAILLTKARQHSLALLGPSAATFFEPVPKEHFSKALFDTIAQWNAESDWKGDERNVVLALARIWYSASTGLIAPKDVAAAWVSERLPAEHRPLICKARAAYLGSEDDDLATPDAGLQAPGASLSFAQGSHDFESLDRGIGRGDRFETAHRLDQYLELSVIGLDHVIEILHLPVGRLPVQLSFALQFGDRCTIARRFVGIERGRLFPVLQASQGLAQDINISSKINFPDASVAQLDRVLGYEPSGRRFESSRMHHILRVFCMFSASAMSICATWM